MDVVRAGHTKVNVYQFFSVPLQQISRPNVKSMHDLKQRKDKSMQQVCLYGSGQASLHFILSHGKGFTSLNEKEPIFNHFELITHVG